jgi:heme/copper-type cytochrome/quinol oxidase subunit 3
MLLWTMLGGVTFLVVKAFEWTDEITHGYTITSNTFWSFYYTAAGLHAAHVLAGVVIMGFVAWQAWRGQELQRVELIGIYWHFVDIIWIFLFPLLYIAK